MLLSRSILLCACLTALAVGAAQACPNHDSATAALSPAQVPASAAAVVAWRPRAWRPAVPAASRAQGLRVAIDPVDGTMGMPQEPMASELLRVGDEAPIPMQYFANGRVGAQLDDRFAEFAVVTLGADGRPSWTCVTGGPGAARFMRQPAVTTARPAPAPGTVWEDK